MTSQGSYDRPSMTEVVQDLEKQVRLSDDPLGKVRLINMRCCVDHQLTFFFFFGFIFWYLDVRPDRTEGQRGLFCRSENGRVDRSTNGATELESSAFGG